MPRPSRQTSPKITQPEVAFLLSQVGFHVAGRFSERMAVFGLKPYHAGIVRVLAEKPGLTQQALSDLLSMFPSRLVGLLDDLDKLKLIERRTSPTDRRTYAVYLTKKGHGLLAKILRSADQLQEDICAGLDKKERQQMADFLNRIVAQQKITPGVHPGYKKIGGA